MWGSGENRRAGVSAWIYLARDSALHEQSRGRGCAASENKVQPFPGGLICRYCHWKSCSSDNILPQFDTATVQGTVQHKLRNIAQATEFRGKAKTHRLQYSIIHGVKDLCWEAIDSLDKSNQ